MLYTTSVAPEALSVGSRLGGPGRPSYETSPFELTARVLESSNYMNFGTLCGENEEVDMLGKLQWDRKSRALDFWLKAASDDVTFDGISVRWFQDESGDGLHTPVEDRLNGMRVRMLGSGTIFGLATSNLAKSLLLLFQLLHIYRQQN